MVRRLLLVACVSAAMVAPGCDGKAPVGGTEPFLSPADPGISPTPPPTPAIRPSASGPSTPTCVNGWVTPRPRTRRAMEPIGIIRWTTPFTGPVLVVDARYFVGPESPPSNKGYLAKVHRWYVKLYVANDPAYQGRFLVESREFGAGVSAVAPFGSQGFHSPDWVGFEWEAADTRAKGYPRLPGRWRGVPYDFVDGGGGLAIPGLPAEVRGCLDGT